MPLLPPCLLDVRSHNSCNLRPAAQRGPETRGAQTRRGKSAGVMQGEARCRPWGRRPPTGPSRIWFLAAVPLASVCAGFCLRWLLSARALSALLHLLHCITPAICLQRRSAARKLGVRRPGVENLQELCTGRRDGVCRSYSGEGRWRRRRRRGAKPAGHEAAKRGGPSGAILVSYSA